MLGSIKRRWLLLESGMLLMVLEVALRTAGFQRSHNALQWLAVKIPFRKKYSPDDALSQEIADIVDHATRTTSLYPSQCLARSLTLHYLLIRHGQVSSLKLGVQTITGHFRAHAWVECNGKELNEKIPANDLFQPVNWSNSTVSEQ